MKLPSRVSLVAISLVAIATILAFSSSLSDAPIVDEVPHIGAGYSYVARGDMRLNPEHPPLIKDLAGLAVVSLIGRSHPSFMTPPWTKDVNGQWNFGRSIIFQSTASPDAIKLAARIPMLFVYLLACFLMWRWSRERYGDTAALITIILFAFSPTILAHGRLVTTDMGAATGVLAATYFFIHDLRTRSRSSFLMAAIALGLALLAKFNTVLLGPYFVLVAIMYGVGGGWNKKANWLRASTHVTRTILIGVTAFVGVVWPLYGLHTLSYPIERQYSDTAAILNGHPDSPLKSAILWASHTPLVRAAGQWALGLAMVQQRSAGGNTIYYLGNVVTAGGPGYFPTVYFLKEPLAWWALFSIALTAMIFHHRRRPHEHTKNHFWTDNLEEWAWILWLLIYWTISMRSTLNIGVRHLLPIYPFMILLVSGRVSVVIEWLRRHDRPRLQWFSLAVAVLLGWYTFESVRVWPAYLTYFNQLAGGPAGGYRYVADSNLDWGQDIKRLGQWLQSNGIEKVSLDYFGWSDPVYYLGSAYTYTTGSYWKDAHDFISRNTTNGWIAISATFYLEATNRAEPGKSTYRWLMDYRPTAVIGNSIFVWHVTQ